MLNSFVERNVTKEKFKKIKDKIKNYVKYYTVNIYKANFVHINVCNNDIIVSITFNKNRSGKKC